MNLGKNEKNTSGEFLYLSFAVTRLKIGLIEKMRKNDIGFAKNGFPCPMKVKVPPESIKYRLQNRNWSCRKKIKFDK